MKNILVKAIALVSISVTVFGADKVPPACKKLGESGFTILADGQRVKTGFIHKNSAVQVFCIGGFGGGLWRAQISKDCNWVKLKRGGLVTPISIASAVKDQLYNAVGSTPIVLKAHSMGAAVTLEMMKLIHADLKVLARREKAKKLLKALSAGGIELHQSAARGTPHLLSGGGSVLSWLSRKTGLVGGIKEMDPSIAQPRMKAQKDFCGFLKDAAGGEIKHVVISSYATKKDLKVFNGEPGRRNRAAQYLMGKVMGAGTSGCSDGYVNAIDTRLKCTKAAYLTNSIHFIPRIDSTDIPMKGRAIRGRGQQRRAGTN